MAIQLLPHLDPRQTLIRYILLSNLRIAEPLGSLLGWSILAVAAVISVILNKLTEIQLLINPAFLKWGLILLAASILFGAVAKQMSEMLVFSSRQILDVSADIFSETGIHLLETAKINVETLAGELSKCYCWPLSMYVRYSAKQGAKNFLLSEIRFSKLLSVDLFISWLHFIAACGGIVLIACGIK